MQTKYEIKMAPSATLMSMIDAECAEKRLPLEAYKDRTVAAHVRHSINRQSWNESGGDEAVQVLMAVLAAETNVAGYQRAMLHEALLRLDEQPGNGWGEKHPLVGKYVLDGLHKRHQRDFRSNPEQEISLRLYRR